MKRVKTEPEGSEKARFFLNPANPVASSYRSKGRRRGRDHNCFCTALASQPLLLETRKRGGKIHKSSTKRRTEEDPG